MGSEQTLVGPLSSPAAGLVVPGCQQCQAWQKKPGGIAWGRFAYRNARGTSGPSQLELRESEELPEGLAGQKFEFKALMKRGWNWC